MNNKCDNLPKMHKLCKNHNLPKLISRRYIKYIHTKKITDPDGFTVNSQQYLREKNNMNVTWNPPEIEKRVNDTFPYVFYEVIIILILKPIKDIIRKAYHWLNLLWM